jgi:hypothetical protein
MSVNTLGQRLWMRTERAERNKRGPASRAIDAEDAFARSRGGCESSARRNTAMRGRASAPDGGLGHVRFSMNLLVCAGNALDKTKRACRMEVRAPDPVVAGARLKRSPGCAQAQPGTVIELGLAPILFR